MTPKINPGGEGLDLDEALATAISCCDNTGFNESAEILRDFRAHRPQVNGGEGAPALEAIDNGIRIHSEPTMVADPYFRGMGNGMIWARSVLTGEEPKFMPAPAVPDALTWTREKPTVEGFYWCRNNQGPGGWIEEIYSRLGDLWTKDMTPVKDLPAYREWAGPLPEPREAPPAPTLGKESK